MCIRETILADVAALVSLTKWSERYISKLIAGHNTFLVRLRDGKVTLRKAEQARDALSKLLAERQAKEAKMRTVGESPTA